MLRIQPITKLRLSFFFAQARNGVRKIKQTRGGSRQ
jgi:hypothetical protein